MYTRKISLLFMLFAAAIIMVAGCKKDSVKVNTVNDTSVEQSSILAEQTFNDIGNYSVSAMSAGKSMMSPDAGCLQVSFDLTALPYKLVLDFGATNCKCEDGLYRRGKIIVSCAGAFGDSLTTLTTTFENFYVSDNEINGTRSLKNKGHNAAGHLNWDVAVDGSIVLAAGGGTIYYQASHNSEMTEGEYTPAFSDNVFSVSGSASGTAVTGQAFASQITTPLISKLSCAYFVSGVVEITPATGAVRILNCGNGECDNIATITVNGVPITFILP